MISFISYAGNHRVNSGETCTDAKAPQWWTWCLFMIIKTQWVVIKLWWWSGPTLATKLFSRRSRYARADFFFAISDSRARHALRIASWMNRSTWRHLAPITIPASAPRRAHVGVSTRYLIKRSKLLHPFGKMLCINRVTRCHGVSPLHNKNNFGWCRHEHYLTVMYN